MRLPRSTTRRLMTLVAAVACLGSIDWSDSRDRPPRAVLPALTAVYLAWAVADGFGAVHGGRPQALRFAWALVVVVLFGAWALGQRSDRFLATAGRHDWDAELCRRSAQGERGTIIACGRKGCGFFPIPRAETAAHRAKMLERAGYHRRMRSKYERAARYPWLPVPPDPPVPE